MLFGILSYCLDILCYVDYFCRLRRCAPDVWFARALAGRGRTRGLSYLQISVPNALGTGTVAVVLGPDLRSQVIAVQSFPRLSATLRPVLMESTASFVSLYWKA